MSPIDTMIKNTEASLDRPTESYLNIGESMGLAMMALLSPPTPELSGRGVTVTNGLPSFTFPTVSGFKYRLVYKNSLTDHAWSPGVWSATSIGAPLSLSDTNAMGQPQRFYRLEAANP